MKQNALSHQGDGLGNEDIVVIENNIYWVFDGATPIYKNMPIDGYTSNAQWLVNELSTIMRKYISNGFSQGFIPLLYMAVPELNEKHSDITAAFSTSDPPSFTLAAVSISDDLLRLHVLGDCAIYLLMNDESVLHIGDNRYNKYEERLTDFRNALHEQGDNSLTKYKELRIEIKKQMNVPGGFWLGAVNTSWIPEIISTEVARENIKRVLLCSDGFARLFKIDNHITVKNILNGDVSIEDGYRYLRSQEESVPELRRLWSKMSDDASAILLSN